MQEKEKATSKDIAAAVIENMHENAEPLNKVILPPSIFHIYLHQDDYNRLQVIFPRLQKDVSTTLDEAVELHNNRVTAVANPVKAVFTRLPEMLKGVIGQKHVERPAPYEKPATGWQISFHLATDEEHKRGDVCVVSELALPQAPELGGGLSTLVLKTIRRHGVSQKISQEATPAIAARAQPDTAKSPAAKSLADSYATYVSAASEPDQDSTRLCARIRYQDNTGPQVYEMTKNQIVIGRGGTGYWVDLQLDTLPDVSREHLRLRCDPATGQFYLKDLSAYGTTINGQAVESSIEKIADKKVDRNIEAPLPARARIGLAGILTLEFEAAAVSHRQ